MGRIFNTLKLWGPLGLFLLSIIESAGIPNPGVTDWVIVALAIGAPSTVWMLAGIATLGSLIGTVFFFELLYKGGESFFKRYSSSRVEKFRGWFLRYGLVTVFISALLPIPILPMKVFVLCSAAMRVNRWRFYGVFLAGRIPRYVGLGYLGAILGEESKARLWIKTHLWAMGGFALVLTLLLYLLIRWNDHNRDRKAAAAGAASGSGGVESVEETRRS